MTDKIKNRNSKQKAELRCTDLCKHCIYIDDGDFICDVNNVVTIVSRAPSPCVCPKKRRLKNGVNRIQKNCFE